MYFPEWVFWVFGIAGGTIIGLSVLFLLVTFIKELNSEEGAF